jgi:hypothetical protein
MIKKLFLFVICLLAVQFMHAQKGIIPDQSIDGFNLRSIDFKKSWAMQQQALAYAKATHNNAAIVKAYALLSVSCRTNEDTFQMRAYLDSAVRIGKIAKDEGFVNYAQARYLKYTNTYKATADNYIKALKAFEQQRNYVFATFCAADICHLFLAPSDSSIAKKYNALAQKFASLANTPNAYLYAGRCNADFLVQQLRMNRNDEAIKKAVATYQHVIANAERTPSQIFNKDELTYCYLNLADQYQRNPSLFPDSLFLGPLQKAKELALAYNFKVVFRNAYGMTGDYLVRKKDFAGAKKSYLQGIDYTRKSMLGDNSSILAFYLALKRVTALQQDWQQYQYFDSAYESQIDQRFDEAIKQAVHEADIKFEASKKTQQIKALQQENDFQRKNKLLFLFIAVLILLVAIFMVRSFYFKMNYSQQQEAVLRIKKEITEKDKTLLENKLLQSQMKPHFIFNTLGAIHGIVLQNKIQEAAALIIQFSRLMRKMLENTQKEWVVFEDEIEMLQHYTALQQIRFNHRFTFEFSTNGIDKHLLIPPMLIQPFVENAIEHGFKNLPENRAGQLKIEFYKINDVLLSCTVTDNGTGRKEKAQAVEQDHTSMATQLTQQRLQYYETTNPGVGLQITDLFEKEQAAGTRVTILLPYQND